MIDPTLSPDRFHDVTEPFLGAHPGVTRSTMMGLPCLRLNGAFFASSDRTTGHLLVKLPAARVDELVNRDVAESFAPAARRFREWAAINPAADDVWTAFVDEAFMFVRQQLDGPASKKRAAGSSHRKE
jgi:hypothetical protein